MELNVIDKTSKDVRSLMDSAKEVSDAIVAKESNRVEGSTKNADSLHLQSVNHQSEQNSAHVQQSEDMVDATNNTANLVAVSSTQHDDCEKDNDVLVSVIDNDVLMIVPKSTSTFSLTLDAHSFVPVASKKNKKTQALMMKQASTSDNISINQTAVEVFPLQVDGSGDKNVPESDPMLSNSARVIVTDSQPLSDSPWLSV